MAEYIEREALLNRMEKRLASLRKDYGDYDHYTDGFEEGCVAVEDADAADVLEVVRCKDCKHWDCYGGEDSHKGDCNELVGLDSCMYEDDFCSYGERKGNV